MIIFFTESSKNSVMAVDNVSFDIKEGESFGLVGESEVENLLLQK